MNNKKNESGELTNQEKLKILSEIEMKMIEVLNKNKLN